MRNYTKKISCALFDLDGVLVDACEWHFESLNRALKEISNIEISRHDHETRFNGLPTKVKLQMLNLDQESIEKIWSLKQRYTIEAIIQKSTIRPEKIDLLRILKEQNVKIACVTNSIRETAILMLSTSELINYFDLIVANEDVSRNKPHPDCYNHAINMLIANPAETMCVEDSEKGIIAAKASLASYVWEVSGCSDVNIKNYTNFIK